MGKLKCSKCSRFKSVENFHAKVRPGRKRQHAYFCKECTRIKHKEYYEDNREGMILKSKKWAEANPITCKKARKKYKKRMRLVEPYKDAARFKVKTAISRGHLIRKPCSICGDVNSEAHHEDYYKPLDVIFLCRKHHRARHKELKDEGIVL